MRSAATFIWHGWIAARDSLKSTAGSLSARNPNQRLFPNHYFSPFLFPFFKGLPMIKYKRPSGAEIEVADTKGNRETAEKLGWKEIKPRKRKAKSDGRDSKHSNS